jgi:hypothetical protein
MDKILMFKNYNAGKTGGLALFDIKKIKFLYPITIMTTKLVISDLF